MANTEIELKFPLKDAKALKVRLDRIAKMDRRDDFQKDTYYTPEHRNFLAAKPVREWLRIRESKKGCSVDYKNWRLNKGTRAIVCDEIECLADNAEDLKLLFKKIGMKQLIIVEKTRNTWLYDSTVIAIDVVKGLGTFIEIEAKGRFKSEDEAKSQLYKVLGKIGAKVTEQDFEGYPHRLLRKKGLV